MAEPARPTTLPRSAVKICGLRTPEHAQAAVSAGADLLGFVFAPSKRQIDAVTARDCIQRAREAAVGRTVIAVGIFVDASVDEMNQVAEIAGLDLLQLHGNSDATIGGRLRHPFVAAFHPSPELTVEDVDTTIGAFASQPQAPIAFLIDGFQVGQLGGQGIRADWNLTRELARRWPIILAGGLTSENVAEAIRVVAPVGVDVSSGVETAGTKVVAKIEAFVRAARQGFAELAGRATP